MVSDPRATALRSDLRADTRRTHVVRDAAMSGSGATSGPRSLIGDSWDRVRARGLDPSGAPEVAPLSQSELYARRERSPLHDLLTPLREYLRPAGDAAGQVLVVSDADGRVLWREGSSGVSRYADRLGFVGGSAWTEGNVGTNAIGTCIVTGSPIHIHAAEHFAQSHTAWTCAAAPLKDPVTGRLLGVVDLSGPARTGHANTLSLVTVAARLAEAEVRAAHQDRLNALRAFASPLLAKVGGKALALTPDGTAAAVTGLVAPTQIALPDEMTAGDQWVPALGMVRAEPLPGGWLLRVLEGDAADPDSATSLLLDLSASEPSVEVTGASSVWTHRPSPRHAEILLALVRHRDGRSAAQLADDLFGDRSRTVTVRAEMSRLRRTLGPMLVQRPYRLADNVDARLVLPDEPLELLPGSTAPVVTALRA